MPACVLFEHALIKALLIVKKAKAAAATIVCAQAAYRKRHPGVAGAPDGGLDLLPAGGALGPHGRRRGLSRRDHADLPLTGGAAPLVKGHQHGRGRRLALDTVSAAMRPRSRGDRRALLGPLRQGLVGRVRGAVPLTRHRRQSRPTASPSLSVAQGGASRGGSAIQQYDDVRIGYGN